MYDIGKSNAHLLKMTLCIEQHNFLTAGLYINFNRGKIQKIKGVSTLSENSVHTVQI